MFKLPNPYKFSLLLVIFASGCELLSTDRDDSPVTTGIYVANQGNFGDRNGSITIHDPIKKTTINDAVPGLGSLLQSVLLHDGRGYVLSNTADRIDVFDLDSNTRLPSITGVTSPRYMAVQGEKAYVTNLYESNFQGGSVTVINLASGEKQKTIPVGDNPEGLVISGQHVFVANFGFGTGRSVSVISSQTDVVEQTVDVGCDGPRGIFADEQQEVWVFCTGQVLYDENWNVVGETPGEVVILGAATRGVVGRIALSGRMGSAGLGQDVYYSPETAEAFAIQGQRILRFDTASNTLAGTIDISGDEVIGAVAYDASSNQLYLGRYTAGPQGFTTAGTVTSHLRNGTLVESFTAGIAPSYITFER